MNRRTFLVTAAAGVGAVAHAQRGSAPPTVPEAIKKLHPMTDGIQPITDEERRGRIEKARRLMRENKLNAIVMEGGTSMFYFTGTRLSSNDAVFSALVIP